MPRTLRLTLLSLALAATAAGVRVCAQENTTQSPATAVQTAAAAEDDFERGKRLLAQGDAAGAIAPLKAAAERRRTDADAWYNLGLALTHAGMQKDARKAFEKSAELRPDSAQAHTGLAYTLLLTGKTDDAGREAAAALRLDPRQPDAHYVLGAARLREQKFEQAVQEAEEALRLKGDHLPAAVLAGQALLSAYGEESDRVAQQYPLPPVQATAERRRVYKLREEKLEPVKARLRAAAERLEGLAGSQPDGADKGGLRELTATLKTYGRPPREDDSSGVLHPYEVTTKAVILSKPEPTYTELARGNGTRGTVRLRVVLGADGRVRDILVLRRLPDGLTEKAVEAARRIRFTPATVGGQPVSQYVVLEYNFAVNVTYHF